MAATASPGPPSADGPDDAPADHADLLGLPPELLLAVLDFLPTICAARLQIALCGAADPRKVALSAAIRGHLGAVVRTLSIRRVFGDRSKQWTREVIEWHLERLGHLEEADFSLTEEVQGDVFLVVPRQVDWRLLFKMQLMPESFAVVQGLAPRSSHQVHAVTGHAIMSPQGVLPLPSSFWHLTSLSLAFCDKVTDDLALHFASLKHVRCLLPHLARLDLSGTPAAFWSLPPRLAAAADALAMRRGIPVSRFGDPSAAFGGHSLPLGMGGIPLFPDPGCLWATTHFPVPAPDPDLPPPANRFHGIHSASRLSTLVALSAQLESLSAALPSAPLLHPALLPEPSPLLAPLLLPIRTRVLPRWFSQDWHCLSHAGIPPGERHWYRPDGTFCFSRTEQARGGVERMSPTGRGWWEVAVRYSDWPAGTPRAVQDWMPVVCVREVERGSGGYERVVREHGGAITGLLAGARHINGDGSAVEHGGARRVRVMRSAQAQGIAWGPPAGFPDEDTDDVVTGLWVAVDDE